MTPTARTLALLKRRGIPAQVVEKWIPIKNHPGGGVRKDLFNVIDIVAIKDGITGIQATSGANLSKRINKINAEPLALAWVKAGGNLAVIGWRKAGKRGKAKRWTPRVMIAEVLPDGESLLWNEEIGAVNTEPQPVQEERLFVAPKGDHYCKNPKCNYMVPDNATICTKCGTPQDAPQPVQENPFRPRPSPDRQVDIDDRPSIETIRDAFFRIHHVAIRKTDRPYMSIPADPARDADLILSAAIDELEEYRRCDKMGGADGDRNSPPAPSTTAPR